MKEYPILFSGEMIRALLAGRKSQTRRLSKQWLKVKHGDVLWVRETLHRPDGDPWLYRADNQPVMVAREDETAMLVWAHHKESDVCVSIHMPRWASRIILEATEDAREERLQEITEEGAIAEGIQAFDFPIPPDPPDQVQRMYGTTGYFPQTDTTAVKAFKRLWDSLHGKDAPWESNPMVVVVSFRAHATPAAGMKPEGAA